MPTWGAEAAAVGGGDPRGGPKFAALVPRLGSRLASGTRKRATNPCTPRIWAADSMSTLGRRGCCGGRRRSTWAEICRTDPAPGEPACVRNAKARNEPMHPEDLGSRPDADTGAPRLLRWAAAIRVVGHDLPHRPSARGAGLRPERESAQRTHAPRGFGQPTQCRHWGAEAAPVGGRRSAWSEICLTDPAPGEPACVRNAKARNEPMHPEDLGSRTDADTGAPPLVRWAAAIRVVRRFVAPTQRPGSRLASGTRKRATNPCTPRIWAADPMPTLGRRGCSGGRRRSAWSEICLTDPAPGEPACGGTRKRATNPCTPRIWAADPMPTLGHRRWCGGRR